MTVDNYAPTSPLLPTNTREAVDRWKVLKNRWESSEKKNARNFTTKQSALRLRVRPSDSLLAQRSWNYFLQEIWRSTCKSKKIPKEPYKTFCTTLSKQEFPPHLLKYILLEK